MVRLQKPLPDPLTPIHTMDALLDSIPALDFQLQTRTGEPFRLSQYQGRRHVVLVFNRGFT